AAAAASTSASENGAPGKPTRSDGSIKVFDMAGSPLVGSGVGDLRPGHGAVSDGLPEPRRGRRGLARGASSGRLKHLTSGEDDAVARRVGSGGRLGGAPGVAAGEVLASSDGTTHEVGRTAAGQVTPQEVLGHDSALLAVVGLSLARGRLRLLVGGSGARL